MEQLAFEKIRATVLELHERNEPINHESFVEWLDGLAKDDPGLREYRLMKHEADMIFYQAKMESRQSKFRQKLEVRKAMFESVIATASSALKSSLLINAGAAVAMLSFLAAINTSSHITLYPIHFANSLLDFARGVLCSAIASATVYFAQYNYQNRHLKTGDGFRWISITLVTASFYFFYMGVDSAYTGFRFMK